MVSKPTGRPRGRPRKGECKAGKPKPCAFWLKASFIDDCARRYGIAQRDAARRKAVAPMKCESLLSRAAQETGDPLLSVDPALAEKAYRVLSAARPSKALDAVISRLRGDEVESLAQYARDLKRSVDRVGEISLRYAIADAVATCAERGTFILSGGAPVSFPRAMRAIYERIANPSSDDLLGFTGRYLFVKPAVEGDVILQPDRGMRRLDQQGERVPDTAFWRRRLEQGDVVYVPKS